MLVTPEVPRGLAGTSGDTEEEARHLLCQHGVKPRPTSPPPANLLAAECWSSPLERERARQRRHLSPGSDGTRFSAIGGTIPKEEDRGANRMLEIVKRDIVRWGNVVKKAGGVDAK